MPEIWAYDESQGYLLVEDLGDLTLVQHPEARRFYPLVLKILAKMQALAPLLPQKALLETVYYDFDLIWEKEVLYFEAWYLRRYRVRGFSPAQKELWRNWVEESVGLFTDWVVLHRDFQSQNILIKDSWPYIIDFQAARLGPPSYDLASLLWDPYQEDLPVEDFLEQYLFLTGRNREEFKLEWRRTSVFRLLQALGAYVKLSLQGKSWFARYIPRAERRLHRLLPPALRETVF